MLGVDDPEEMTPEERLQEIAAILAVGFLRMKKQRGYCGDIIFDEQ